MSSSDKRPLDPLPVRYRSTNNRTAILGLLSTHPRSYVFDPRPGFNQERQNYREETVTRTVSETRIVGADYSTREARR